MMDPTGLVPAICAAIRTSTGYECGDGRDPGPDQIAAVCPFAVVYDLPSPAEAVTYASGWDQTWQTVQVTSVGKTATQARTMANLVRTAILAKTGSVFTETIDPAGVEVCARTISELGGVVQEGGLVNVHDRFRFLLTG